MIVEIEKIINGGYGLARTDHGICMVPYAVPGDILDVECSSDTSAMFCWIKKIVKPSIHRIESDCPNFGFCGGCDFQNIAYNYEIEVKKNIIKEDMKRISSIIIQDLGIISAMPYHYRNNVQLKTGENGEIGFFRKKSNDVIPMPTNKNGCLLIDRRINAFIHEIRERVNFNKGGFRVRTNRKGKIYKKGIPGIEDDKYCYYTALGIEYRIGIDDFFQVNNYLYEDWLKIVIEFVSPTRNDTVVDLFAGSGFASLALAKEVKKVYGMEINGSAVKNAKYNSNINGIDNVIFKRVDVNKGFYLTDEITKIIADPPRSGMNRKLIEELVKYNPELIVYVSCNTATFSRDVGILYKNGYKIDKITMIDLFPRTAHIEVIARLISK